VLSGGGKEDILERVGEARFRFGEFEFDAVTGELRRGAEVQRLAPQPARVLALLADRRGELVGRDEIRRVVWNGVEVEFETSLHFCIRQIRAALSDSATTPRYIETLPRRGYRLIPEVRPLEAPSESAPRRSRRRWPTALALAGLVALVLAALWLRFGGLGGMRSEASTPAIAIMPFVPPSETAELEGGTPLADRILAELTSRAGERARIVGPTTTRSYSGSAASITELARAYELDYIVNGRFLDDEHGARMLAELIRTSDGAHVWVQSYRSIDDADRIGEEIAAAVLARLDLAE